MQHIIVDIAFPSPPNLGLFEILHEQLVAALNVSTYHVQRFDDPDLVVFVTSSFQFLLTSVIDFFHQSSMISLYCKDLPNTKFLLDEIKRQFPHAPMVCCIYDHCSPTQVKQRDSFLVLDGGSLDLPLSVEVLTDPAND